MILRVRSITVTVTGHATHRKCTRARCLLDLR